MTNSNAPFKEGSVEVWSRLQLTVPPGLNLTLKPMQKAIINCNRQHDVLVNLPTGFGKSMLYQYQALLSDNKVILVIVPLKALLWDSIIQATKLGLSAFELNQQVIRKIDISNPPKLLFATPQRLYRSGNAYDTVEELVLQNKMELFVIDQAHCVCEWGNDFRPDYAKLNSLREDFGSVRVLAMTATAPPHLRNEIGQKLRLKDPYFFSASYNRPNLMYETIRTTKTNLSTVVMELVDREFSNQSGIIYCQTIKLCQRLHQQIKGIVNCELFHSRIADTKRQRILDNFKKGEGCVIIATICFGMGINKADVRFVIHAGMPFSVENYYQQSGRAGRDGRPARCILLGFQGQDNTLLYLLDRAKSEYGTSYSLYKHKKSQLDMMVRYVGNKKECRKKFMFRLLGQNFDSCNNTCDICLRSQELQVIDFTQKGTEILNGLMEVGNRLTKIQLKDILKGKGRDKAASNVKSIQGTLKTWKEEEILNVIQQLLHQGFLRQNVKKTKYSIVKRLGVNRYKKYDKIMIQKEFRPEIAPSLGVSKISQYIRRKLDGVTKGQQQKESENQYQQPLVEAVMYNYNPQNMPLSQSFQFMERNQGQDAKEEDWEETEPIEINEYDIKTIMPTCTIKIQDSKQPPIAQFLAPKTSAQKFKLDLPRPGPQTNLLRICSKYLVKTTASEDKKPNVSQLDGQTEFIEKSHLLSEVRKKVNFGQFL